jgi:hypothetical protein
VSEHVVLLREVDARRELGDRRIRLHVLAPYGNWIGNGALRVLRMVVRQAQDDSVPMESEVELIAGYESYSP